MDNLTLFFLVFGLSNRSDILDWIMIFGAEYLIYLTFVLMFIIAIYGQVKDKKALLLSVISLPIVVLIIKVIHLFIFEPRPFISLEVSPLISHQADASFPSRHTSIISAIAFVYLYYRSKWVPLFLLSLIWIGVSRIYVGVHYPLDILGGIVVGIISLGIALQIKKLLKISFFT